MANVIFITAKFESRCVETNRAIIKGAKCAWVKEKNAVYHPESPTYKNEKLMRNKKTSKLTKL